MKEKISCGIARDLLPLYADGVCGQESREAVERHLADCKTCKKELEQLKNEEVSQAVSVEMGTVLESRNRRIRRKCLRAASILGCIFTLPVLICLIVNLALGAALDWLFIELLAMLTAASLTVLPLLAEKHRFLVTLGGFTVSLEGLLLFCAFHTHGEWFPVAGSAVLFGLGMLFFPTVASRLLPGSLKPWRSLVVLGLDTLCYGLMMAAIQFTYAPENFVRLTVAISLPLVGFLWIWFLTRKLFGRNAFLKVGIGLLLWGCLILVGSWLTETLLGEAPSFPKPSFFLWNDGTADGNIKWLSCLGLGLLGLPFLAWGTEKEIRKKEKRQ